MKRRVSTAAGEHEAERAARSDPCAVDHTAAAPLLENAGRPLPAAPDQSDIDSVREPLRNAPEFRYYLYV
jgi:hypothetical protein